VTTRGALMHAEMSEQPSVLRTLASRRPETVDRLRAALPPNPAGYALVARGSSDNAAIFGRYILEVTARRPVSLVAPSLLTLYQAQTDYSGYIAVAISQSGETPEIVQTMHELRRRGAWVVAVTNSSDSPLASQADISLELHAGRERAIPATKTFTAQLAAMAVLAEASREVPWRDRHWERIPSAVEEVLDDWSAVEQTAEALTTATGMITVGRGYLFPVALEAALKIKETTSMLTIGYSAADLRHGPIAIVERDYPVLAYLTDGPARTDMEALVAELRQRGAPVVVADTGGVADLRLPDGLPEALVTIPAAVRAQQLAHTLALRLGLDPDTPEGLSKVTRS